MTLRLNGSTSGYTEIDAPAVAGSNTLVLPTGNGSADQALVTNGSGTLSFADRGRMVLATAQNSTSGTSIDFTGIPSWVKRVTVMLDRVSTNGTSVVQLQLGTGSFTPTTSGYNGLSFISLTGTGSLVTNITTGMAIMADGSASYSRVGPIVINNITGNSWSMSWCGGDSASARVGTAAATVSLSAALTGIRITTVNGTDTFDAGSINILMEG
jgi:hypothetical protein